MLVLHLPPGVLDGVHKALQEVRGRRREVRKGTTPRQSRSDQLVQEDTLHGHRLQYWRGGKNRVARSKEGKVWGDVTSTAGVSSNSDRETLITVLTNFWLFIFSLCVLRAVERWKVTLEQPGNRRLAQEGAEACRSSPDTSSVLRTDEQLIKSMCCVPHWPGWQLNLTMRSLCHVPSTFPTSLAFFCWIRLRKQEAWTIACIFFFLFSPQAG